MLAESDLARENNAMAGDQQIECYEMTIVGSISKLLYMRLYI